jgi:hypothetical protein
VEDAVDAGEGGKDLGAEQAVRVADYADAHSYIQENETSSAAT